MDIGWPEILIIAIVVLVLFGSRKLPDAARSLGKSMRILKTEIKDRHVHDKCTLVVTGVLDPFTVTLKLSLYAGLVLSSPIWLWQLWRFITPGLYQNEKRWAITFVGASVGLFALGGAVAWLTLSRGL